MAAVVEQPNELNLLNDLIARARAQGADAADAVMVDAVSVSYAQRLGATEKLEREESQDLGLRVLLGPKQAVVSSTDLSAEALEDLVTRALAMAKTVPDDPYCGLAQPDQLATSFPELDGFDAREPATDALIERARSCEEAARAVAGVTNSEGAEASWSRSRIAVAGSNGFAGAYRLTRHGIGTSVIAGEGTAMETGYDFAAAAHAEDLRDPAEIGRRAGERAVKRLNPRKVETAQVPVVYESDIAGRLLSHLAGAISGPAVARGTSFLKDRMESQVFATGVRVMDDPLRPRGLRSKPFDGEGIAGRKRAVIEDGVLKTWLLDLASARQLGLETTGHAARGTSSPPSPAATNLYLEPGGASPDELMADIRAGFYVTTLMGMGVNQVTGDYSFGAAGFWIEDGEIAYPVSELTIAGNLNDMYRTLMPANDLVFRFGVDAPTVRIEGMTVAGMATAG